MVMANLLKLLRLVQVQALVHDGCEPSSYQMGSLGFNEALMKKFLIN